MIRTAWLARALAAAALALSLAAHAGAYDDFQAALRRDQAAAVAQLLARGVDPNSVDAQGTPALVAALREKSYSVARVLAEHPQTRIDAVGPVDETALMVACHQGRLDLARLLVQRGAQVNRPGWTPLHYAAAEGQLETVRFLLDEAAYIDAESPNGTTPLMMAARHKQLTVLHELIAQGADPTVRNQSGLTAADYLERQGERDEAAAVQAGADAFQRRYRGAGAGRAPGAPVAGRATGERAVPASSSAAPAGRTAARLPGERPAADH